MSGKAWSLSDDLRYYYSRRPQPRRPTPADEIELAMRREILKFVDEHADKFSHLDEMTLTRVVHLSVPDNDYRGNGVELAKTERLLRRLSNANVENFVISANMQTLSGGKRVESLFATDCPLGNTVRLAVLVVEPSADDSSLVMAINRRSDNTPTDEIQRLNITVEFDWYCRDDLIARNARSFVSLEYKDEKARQLWRACLGLDVR